MGTGKLIETAELPEFTFYKSASNARPDLAVTHPISERKGSHENLMYPKVYVAIWL